MTHNGIQFTIKKKDMLSDSNVSSLEQRRLISPKKISHQHEFISEFMSEIKILLHK